MYLPFTRASDTITKWILCFRKETINDVSNISICNNLGVIQLKGICEDLSELSLPLLSNFRINEYNTSADPLNVFKSNTNQCEAITSTDETRIRIDSEKNCQRDKTHRYMTMQIPVTKPVFMKVIGMSTCAETKLSDSEILNIMEHLLIFLDNQRSVQRLICQYFLNDNGLYDRLGTLCEKRTGQIGQKKSCFEVAYCNLVMEMRNEMCVYSEDEHYNVVFMSDIQEKKNRLLVHTNFLNMASCLFPKNVMEMNSGFLFNNREKLYNLYREASLDESLLVIDIDFSDIFHDPVGKSYIESFCSVARLNIHKVLRCNFLALCCVKKIVLRFEKTHLTFDLAFLSTVEVDMHLKKCVLRNCVLFPKYLKKLKISNSFIRCSIVLPENLEEISLKDTEIIKDSTVRVDEGCRAICIDQCSGNIYIPYIEKNFHVTFGGTWSVKLVRNSDCFIDVLKMANGTFTDSLEKMNQNIKMLILEEVELLAELVLVLGKFLENITLTKCTGIIRLYTPISEQSIHIRINYGQLVFVRSKKNDSWEFILQSALLMNTVKFNDRLSKLHICGVDFKLDSHIEVHKNTRNVILDNSYRSVFLDDVTGRKKIIPIEQKDFCLEMSDESSPFNSSDVTRSYESQRLLLKYAHVNNSEFLKSNIKRLEFRNVIVEENCVLQIDDGFEELKLYGCIGKFKIPFVSYESESMIDFHETGCSLEIVKTSISTYNLAITNMNTSRSISVDACISDLNLQHVVMNEDSVFSLKRTCTNICLSYFKGRIIAPHITALDRLVLSNMNLTTNQFLLSIPTNFLEAKSVVLDHSIVVLGAFAQTMYLRWAKLSTETAIQIISTNNLNNFAFSSIATRIDITSIIRSMENSEPSFLVDGDIKYFSEEGMNGCTTFELRNFQVRAHSELAKNVQFVDLEYVFSDNNSILRLNKEVEYIRITFCQANIDVAMVKELKSAVINCSSFVYDQKIYQSLTYLCISDLTIEQNVYLGENLQTLKLEGVTISRNCTFAISKNISRLHIERSCGMMCMLGVGGFTSLALDCGNTLEYVSVPTTRGSYSLRLSNFCFESDIRLSDDIEEVIIEYAKVTNNVKLLLGRECKSVELNTNCINLDNTRASNLQKITLIAISSHVLSQIFSINSLNCLTLEKLNLNSVTKCANHIRTVILRMIDVPEDRIFYVGENCEEFQLLQCNGTFDLSAVKVLRRFVVIPRLNGTMCLKPLHSSLRTVRSLEIAYNFKSSFLQQVLAWCVNVERLTLHGLYYDEAIRSHAFSYISFEKIFGVFVTDIWLKKKHAGLPKHCPTKYDKMMIINLKMNVVFNDMLTFKTWSRLKYLNLVGFSPDSRNTKLLRLFRNLKTLIVDYHFIDEYFFSFLPHELETLKIAERNVLVDSTYDTDTPKCNLDLEGLKDNRNLKTLNLNKEISRISAVFNFLPESLETLQVTWFFLNDACRVKILTKKIALKQLVLCVNTEEKSSFIDRNPFTRQYRSLFDYFRNFIDFESLIELTLEVNGEQINLDTKTYRIK